MDTRYLKAAMFLSIVSIILMMASVFGAWYVWESESRDDETREFSREWKLNEAKDSYEYRYGKGEYEEVHKGTVNIDYKEEELKYENGELTRESKFGKYENTVNVFLRLFFLVLLGIVLAIIFASGIGLAFLRNLDRSNLFALGGMAIFFCILPSLLLIITLDPAVTEDNKNYEIEERPDSNDYDDLYRYELEGSASSAKIDGISGDTNVFFNDRDYEVRWKPGIAFYLSIISGILTGISVVMVALTEKDYFSHRTPYHPRSIPAPALVLFPKKALIPVLITIGLIFLVFFMLLIPWWQYEYHATFTNEDDEERRVEMNITLKTRLQRPELQYETHKYSSEEDETETETEHIAYMDKDEKVMDRSLLLLLSGLGTMIFALPIIFMMVTGRLDRKNGFPFLVLPAAILFITAIYFMAAFPPAFNDSLEREGNPAGDYGFTHDGSFIGGDRANNTISGVDVKSSTEWGPCAGWYLTLMAGLLYLFVPISIFVWKKDILNPEFFYPDTGSPSTRPGPEALPGPGFFRGMAGQGTPYPPFVEPRTITREPGMESAGMPISPAAGEAIKTAKQTAEGVPQTLKMRCQYCNETFETSLIKDTIYCPYCGAELNMSAHHNRI